ncbi:MAG TPA: arginine deiminase family protein [Pyrinomonadaceae bacterium]|jgi:dimethylargininase
MLRAITHKVSPRIAECEVTFVDRSPIDFQIAASQHDAYCNVLKKLGVIVKEFSENESYPDSCFVEDTAIVVDEIAIICSMGVSSRRGETRSIEQELSKYREITHVSLPATIEGGDVLRIGKKIFVGQSNRTNLEGVKELTKILEPYCYSVAHVPTKGSLHLKTACTAIDEETLLVNPAWVELDAFKGFKLVNTPAEEPWSANLLRVGNTVCVQTAFPRTVELIEQLVERVELIDMSELGKAEAGLTCSSIVFESAI